MPFIQLNTPEFEEQTQIALIDRAHGQQLLQQ
jgi:hypothetical protein